MSENVSLSAQLSFTLETQLPLNLLLLTVFKDTIRWDEKAGMTVLMANFLAFTCQISRLCGFIA